MNMELYNAKPEVRARKRAWARENYNASQHRRDYRKQYARTVPGYLTRTYESMKGRIAARSAVLKKYYANRAICSRDEFLDWVDQDKTFYTLYAAWVAAGFTRKLSPSIDRIVSLRGYEIGNLQWLTQSDNVKKALAFRYSK